MTAASTRARCVFEGELRIGGQEHFYLETQARSRGSTRAAVVAVHSSTQHPSETQEIVARVLGVPRNQRDGRVPAHGRRVRRQGSAGQPVCGDRGARRVEDAAPGARAADARARHGAHRQAASVPGALRRGFRARRPAEGAAARAVLRRRLEPGPVRAGHVALDVPLRQRIPLAGGRGRPAACAGRTRRRRPRSAASAGRRACWSSRRSCRRRRTRLALPADVVRERNFYRDGDTTHYGQPVDDADRIDDDLERAEGDRATSTRAAARSTAFNARASITSSAAWRSRR